jgi:hypothetical protein
MGEEAELPRALFFGDEGALLPDDLVCSGRTPGRETGEPCPFSESGRMPLPRPQRADSPGDVAPPCAVQALGSLAEFAGEASGRYELKLHPLRVFKCRKLFLLVVPGLIDHTDRSAGGPK